MRIWSRRAAREDVATLLPMYRSLEKEQSELRHMWRYADGLPEPAEAALKAIFEDKESLVVVGMIDETPLGFAWAVAEDLLPQADGSKIAVIRLIHTETGARGVGVGEAMISQLLEHFRGLGISKFDAWVSPGHRNAKNFFEANGFKARLIVMNHDDDT